MYVEANGYRIALSAFGDSLLRTAWLPWWRITRPVGGRRWLAVQWLRLQLSVSWPRREGKRHA